MKQFCKRIGAFVLAMLLVVVSSLLLPVVSPESALAEGGVKQKLMEFYKKHPDGTYWKQSFNGATQCLGFAMLAVHEIFGKSGNRYRSWGYEGNSLVGMVLVDQLSFTKCTAVNVTAMMRNAREGDILQFGYGDGGQHTMIVYSVANDKDTVTLYDNNFGSVANECKIRFQTISFAALAARRVRGKDTRRGPLSLLRADNWDEINGSVNKYYPYDVNGYVDGKKVGTLNGLAKFDVDINSARVGSQVVDFYRDCQDGSTYSVSNVKAADGYEYLGPSTAGSGLSGKISGAAVETILMFKRKNYVFDLNGIVDDAEVRTLEGVGTVDIYMNGKLVADDVSDYTKEWPYGTEYEITDFKAKSGYAYTNTYKKGGGMKGRIGAGTMEVFPWFVSEGKAMSTGYDRVLPDGDYIVRNAADMGKTYYLDVPGIEWPAPEGTEVSLYMKENGVKVYRHDVWTLKYEGGYYTVTQAGTDMALSAVNRRHGAGIQLGSKDAAARWAIQYSAADGAYVMQSSQSGYYLDVAGELAVGASVQQSKDAGTRSGWLMIPYEPVAAVAEGRYVLISDADGAQVADIEGDSYEIGNGVNVLPGPAEGQNRYNAFDVTPLREGFYTLRQAGSGKALEVAYGAEGAGKNVQVGTYSAGYHQQWALLPQGDGYALVSRASGFAMAIDGENIVQSRRSGEAGQRWQLAPVHAVRYDANGGFGAPKDQEAYYHNALTVSKLEPTRLGWVFTGWATSPDAAKAEYLPGRDYSIETDLKLYAVWKQAQRVELPDDLEAVERRSFAGTSAQEIVIPQGCKSIASQAFAESGSLIAVVIPDSVTDIADDAFQGSTNVVLYAHSGAYAQQYALMYGIAFAAMEE